MNTLHVLSELWPSRLVFLVVGFADAAREQSSLRPYSQQTFISFQLLGKPVRTIHVFMRFLGHVYGLQQAVSPLVWNYIQCGFDQAKYVAVQAGGTWA